MSLAACLRPSVNSIPICFAAGLTVPGSSSTSGDETEGHSNTCVCVLPAYTEKKNARSLGGSTVLSVDDERVIVTWVDELHGFGVPITATMVPLKALEAARASETPRFKASTT